MRQEAKRCGDVKLTGSKKCDVIISKCHDRDQTSVADKLRAQNSIYKQYASMRSAWRRLAQHIRANAKMFCFEVTPRVTGDNTDGVARCHSGLAALLKRRLSTRCFLWQAGLVQLDGTAVVGGGRRLRRRRLRDRQRRLENVRDHLVLHPATILLPSGSVLLNRKHFEPHRAVTQQACHEQRVAPGQEVLETWKNKCAWKCDTTTKMSV